MDTQIKGFADSMYERSFVESAVSTRADTTNLMKQRSTKRTAKNPLGDSEINTIIRFQMKHIERCMTARLESYQRAYEETGKVPTEEELEEILEELRTVGGLQVKHSSSFIENFLRAKRAPVQCDPEQGLMEGCANAHDRVFQTWKIWGDKVRIKEAAPAKVRATAKAEAPTKTSPKVAAQTIVGTEPEQAEAKPRDKGRPHRTLLSYYWDFFKRLGNECHHTWRGELAAAALTGTGSYLLIHRVNAVGWTNFKSAGLSMVIAIASIAVWHVLRTPWLLHKEGISAGGVTRRYIGLTACLGLLCLRESSGVAGCTQGSSSPSPLLPSWRHLT